MLKKLCNKEDCTVKGFILVYSLNFQLKSLKIKWQFFYFMLYHFTNLSGMDHFGYRGMDLSGAAIFFKNVIAIPHCPTVTVHDLCCSSNLAHSTGYLPSALQQNSCKGGDN